MAFVFRSQKIGIFQSSDQKSQLHEAELSKEYSRIVHYRDNRFQGQKISRLKDRTGYCSEPSIPKNEVYEAGIDTEAKTKEKNVYDFRLLKKRKQYYNTSHQKDAQKNQHTARIMLGKDNVDIKKIRKKKKQNKKILLQKGTNQCISPSNRTPGPGFYNPLVKIPVHAPKFSFPHVHSIKNAKEEQSSSSQEQQVSFCVRYDQTNSKNFKKSLNLVNQSNRNLLQKIFYEKSSQLTSPENQLMQIQQYKQTDQLESPGPCQYNTFHQTKDRSHLFPKEKRFKIRLSSSPSKQFYQKKYPDQYEYVHSYPNFSSTSKRFQDIKETQRPLQYANYEDSMRDHLKNRKRVPFDFVIQRTQKLKQDDRPYYDLGLRQKEQFLGKFCKYTSQKGLFNQIQKVGASPTSYQTFPKWQKQHSLVIKQRSKEYWKEKENCGERQKPNFYLCSQQSMMKQEQYLTGNNLEPKQTVQKQSRQSRWRNNCRSTQSGRKAKLQYMEYQMGNNLGWQKKSFNTNFSFEPLRANNPIKNRIL